MYICQCCVYLYMCVYNIYVLEEQDAVTTRVLGFKKRYEKRVGPISKKSLEK